MVDAILVKGLRLGGEWIRSIEGPQPNPRPTDSFPWDAQLRSRWPEITAEWVAFRSVGGKLPRIEQVLEESQGNIGTWEAGLLMSGGRPCTLLAEQFPVTTAALSAVPGIRSALWSVLDAGAAIPDHVGPNPGVLRYHLGIDCPEGAAIRIGSATTAYRDGATILLDDVVSHEAWNHGDRERVTLFCDMLRPLPGPWYSVNAAAQRLLMLDRRYRMAPKRADAWHIALNPMLTHPPVH